MNLINDPRDENHDFFEVARAVSAVPLSGQSLAHYQLIGLLGVGGMGEVYRARDTRLGRDVAIKVLPDAMTADVSRLARFKREAQLLAALSHANIAAIYGLDEAGGRPFLVLEFVDGETLAARLARASLSVEESISIGRQIAAALEEAHEHGIVHRDLKPSNIQLTPSGKVKVLDFGLARAYSDEPGGKDPSAITSAGSRPGTVLGTPAYMSPEQARGQPLDRRTDIWAFGAVLYEMLAGRRAFAGETASDTIAAILTREPEWAGLPATTPNALKRLVRRCLARDQKERLRDIGDARTTLEHAAPRTHVDPLGDDANSEVTGPARLPAWRKIAPWMAATGLAVSITVLAAKPVRPGREDKALRLSASLGIKGSLVTTFGAGAILSPDGSLLAFTARESENDPARLYTRRLDAAEARPLAGTEGAESPFFSPDGGWVAFFADGKLKKVSIDGASLLTVCDAPSGRGGSWAEGGTITFMPDFVIGTALYHVAAAGGIVTPLPNLEAGEQARRWPQVLPRGRGVLYTSHRFPSDFDDATIVVQPPQGGSKKMLLKDGYYARYVPSGHILYVRKGNLFAVPFDLEKLEIRGPSTMVIEGIGANPDTGGAQFAFAGNGTFAYVSGQATTLQGPIDWVERGGRITPMRETPSDWTGIHFSPDGKRLVMQLFDGRQWDVWVYEWARDTLSRLTFDPAGDEMPTWTPDGQRITYGSRRGDGETANIYWEEAEGAGEVDRLTESGNNQQPISWHPSGRFLSFIEQDAQTSWDIMILPMEGHAPEGFKPGKPVPFLNTKGTEVEPVFSPDGRWIAYFSDESGSYEVYVRPFPGPGGKWQVSLGGGVYPTWSRNKPELFYGASADLQIMAVPYSTDGNSFRAERPRPWSERPVAGRRSNRFYDVHPDGLRLAASRVAENPRDTAPDHINVVLNFFDELRRLAPAGGVASR